MGQGCPGPSGAFAMFSDHPHLRNPCGPIRFCWIPCRSGRTAIVRAVDPVGACRAFVSVSERGGLTVGAADARMSQSVASRRVAALEERLGEQLFQRASRRALLTPFGRDMLLAARRRLVQAGDVLLVEGEAVKLKPWRLAVPGICSTSALARLVADVRGAASRADDGQVQHHRLGAVGGAGAEGGRLSAESSMGLQSNDLPHAQEAHRPGVLPQPRPEHLLRPGRVRGRPLRGWCGCRVRRRRRRSRRAFGRIRGVWPAASRG